MYIDSGSPDDDRKKIDNDRKSISVIASRALRAHIVDDAPSDLDEVMSKIPRSPGWVCGLVFVSAVVGLWTAIFLVVRALLH